MRDLADKIDNTAPATTGRLSAAEFNALQREAESAVSVTGIILDGASADTDLQMLAQAMCRAASGGVYYTDSGSANAYVLSTPLSFIMPKAFFLGMRAIWIPGATNTTTATANVAAIGAKAILRYDGSALSANNLIVGRPVEMIYSPTANSGAGAWLLQPWCLPSIAAAHKATAFTQNALSDITGIFTDNIAQTLSISGANYIDCQLAANCVNNSAVAAVPITINARLYSGATLIDSGDLHLGSYVAPNSGAGMSIRQIWQGLNPATTYTVKLAVQKGASATPCPVQDAYIVALYG